VLPPVGVSLDQKPTSFWSPESSAWVNGRWHVMIPVVAADGGDHLVSSAGNPRDFSAPIAISSWGKLESACSKNTDWPANGPCLSKKPCDGHWRLSDRHVHWMRGRVLGADVGSSRSCDPDFHFHWVNSNSAALIPARRGCNYGAIFGGSTSSILA